MQSNSRILAAEAVGTAGLLIGGVGSAVLGGGIGTLGISLAFGLSLLVMAYTIGHISGCHINPAVTLAMVITRKVQPATVPFYIAGQLIGAAIGATIVFGIARGLDDFDTFGNFAQNGWGEWSPGGYGLGSTIIVEVFFTALLVLVVLATTHRSFTPGFNAIAAGFTLALIHMVTIPIDNTSVNPARSFGAAIFSDSDAWVQLWAFIVFPLIGAVLGVFVWLMIDDSRLEDTMVYNPALAQARDMATNAIDEVVEKVDDVTDGKD
jgi:aquaporin Z